MRLAEIDQVWNRAALQSGGLNPGEGDRALAALLVAHGMVMNGGVAHALESLSSEERSAAAAGFRFFSFSDIADLFGNATTGQQPAANTDDRCRFPTMASSRLAFASYSQGRQSSLLRCSARRPTSR
jgi:hypothetical protein